MDPYDIGLAFSEIEDELIDSMIRNMRRHRIEEIDEKMQWTQWQAEQLKGLAAYKKANKKKFQGKFSEINDMIDKAIKEARAQGNMDQELEILEAIKNGFTGYSKEDADVMGEFFKVNDRKLDALIKATKNDFQKGEQAILRMAEDQYRQVIFNAQVYANTGAGTYEKAVDMATKDFLSRGINCIEYANGARHTMKDYADMAIRTAAKRAYLAGEGEKRKEWGISTVIVNKRGNPCPKCLPFVGKVLIDDVYSGGSSKDGKYPLLSRAMKLGLYHPRCKDAHSTYFPGITTADDKWTKAELKAVEKNYEADQKQQYAKRQTEKFERLEKYSLDEENQEYFGQKANAWKRVRFKTGNLSTQEYVSEQRLKQYFSGPTDITDKWEKLIDSVGKESSDLLEYTVGDMQYVVDGKHIKLDYSKHEKRIADSIAKKYGKEVQMVPRVIYPQNVQTPDYLIDGVGFDLKTPVGKSKNTLYGAVKSKKRQANNFIICIDETELSMEQIEEQIRGIYKSKHTRFVDSIVVIKNDEIVKAYKRKK